MNPFSRSLNFSALAINLFSRPPCFSARAMNVFSRLSTYCCTYLALSPRHKYCSTDSQQLLTFHCIHACSYTEMHKIVGDHSALPRVYQSRYICFVAKISCIAPTHFILRVHSLICRQLVSRCLPCTCINLIPLSCYLRFATCRS